MITIIRLLPLHVVCSKFASYFEQHFVIYSLRGVELAGYEFNKILKLYD